MNEESSSGTYPGDFDAQDLAALTQSGNFLLARSQGESLGGLVVADLTQSVRQSFLRHQDRCSYETAWNTGNL